MAGARRRIYSPTSPLIAREDLRFSGRPVATRAVVPEEYFSSARQRRVQWDARKVDHAEDLPKKRVPVPPAPTALPAVTVQPDTFVAAAEALAAVTAAPATPSADVAAVVEQVNAVLAAPSDGGVTLRPLAPSQPISGRHKRR